MRIDLSDAAKLISEQDKILILTHAHPDGDTLGCGFALGRALLKMGKQVQVQCGDVIPEKYHYMFESTAFSDFEEPEYIIAVDVADEKLLGSAFEKKYAGWINLAIDHHASNKNYCNYTLLDSNAAAACELIFLLIKEWDIPIDADMASCLYTGLSTDTGCFRYYNATSRTYRIAAELIDCGANSGRINQIMFETKTKTYVELERLALATMETHFDNKCQIISVTQDMFRRSGSDESECDPLAAKTRQMEGVLVGAVLRERKDGTFKVSMRTNDPVDASVICSRLGGGGHKYAAGGELDGPYEEARKILLETIGEFLK